MKETKSKRGAITRLFLAADGRLRAGWLLFLGLVLYFLWSRGAALGLTTAYAGLFRDWGLTEANFTQAPAWARAIYTASGPIVSLVVSLGVIAISRALLRIFRGTQSPPRLNWKGFAAGFGAGTLAVLAGAAVFVLADSMRVDLRGSAGVNAEPFLFLPVCLAAACAEEAFTRVFVLRLASEGLKGRLFEKILICGCSAVVLLLTGGSPSLGVPGAANLLLTGFLCAWLRLRGHGSASLGLRFAWGYVSVAVLRFPGGNAVARPLCALYHVSEGWLTGGNRGLIAGVWTTLVLILGFAGFWLCDKKRAVRSKGE